MSGSGNDFVVFDARTEPAGVLQSPGRIGQLCARGTGIGADGVVFLQTDASHPFSIRYFNRDGSLGELCGNASLCSVRLGVDLGVAPATGFTFGTDAGPMRARISAGQPEIDLPAIVELQSSTGLDRGQAESRIGFANTGVPHFVVLVDDLDGVDLMRRGRELRYHASRPKGANVNFVARDRAGAWRMRTYERGVEGETLACGTGAIASAALLRTWGLETGPAVSLTTRSGNVLTVSLAEGDGTLKPSLRGEGRLVFVGELADAAAG